MKRIVFSLALLASVANFQAQNKVEVKTDSTFLKNWMHSDFEATGVYGVNTLKAKEFLKEHNRKPNNIVVGVLDVDSEHLNHFDQTDQEYLEELARLINFNNASN